MFFGLLLIKMSSEMEELRESFGLIFSFPSVSRLLIILVLQVFVIFILQVKLSVSLRGAVLSIMMLVLSYLMLFALLFLPENMHAFTLKRIVGFLNVLTAIIVLAYLVYTILSGPAIIILGAIAFLEYITLLSIVDSKSTYVFSLTILNSLMFSTSFILGVGLSPIKYMAKMLVFLFIFTAMAHLLMFSVSSKLRITKRTDPLKLLRAYLFLQLKKDRTRIDEEFEKLAIEREIPIAVALFENEKNKPILILVGAMIHPGPILYAGSSDFPYILAKELSKTFSCPTIFLKGACSHESNLPSLREQLRIIDIIKNRIVTLMKKDEYVDKIPHPRIILHNHTHITTLSLGDLSYIIPSNAPEPTEDLKIDLGYAAIEMGKLVSRNIFLVDAHNSLNDPILGLTINTDEPSYFDIIRAISEVIKTNQEEGKIFRVGAAVSHCKEITLEDGLGAAGISTFVFEVENKKHVFVVYDSNNITPSLYLEAKNRIQREFKAETIEIMSTDTHTVCALSPDTMYTILGNKKQDKIIEYTINTIKKAIQNLQKAKVKRDMFSLRAKVLGEKNIEILKSLAVSGPRSGKTDLIRMCTIATLLSIIIYLII